MEYLVIIFLACVIAVESNGTLRSFPLQEGPLMGRTVDCGDVDECEDIHAGFDSKICGSNGKTFKSLCEFMRAHCKEGTVNFKSFGECSVSEKCFGERKAAVNEAKTKKGVFIPGCNSDGTFKAVQCHKDTGYCWCSSALGQAVRGTVMHNAVPDCHNLTQKFPENTSTERPPIWYQGDCDNRRREQFNKNMLINMITEFKRENRLPDQSSESVQNAALQWKFDELNIRKDDRLRKAEYKGIQKIVRRNFKPRKCAKRFPKFCDQNGDKSISLKEWLLCFTSEEDQNGVFVKGKSHKKKGKLNDGKVKLGKGPVRKPRPCEHDQKQALEITGRNIYAPKCDADGKFRPVQCYGSNITESWYCFCVNVENGKMIENTSVRYGTPNCSVSWPNCPPPDRERKFLKALRNYFKKYAKELRKNEASVMVVSDENFVEIIFRYLDQNKNNYIEQKERRRLKKILPRKDKEIWNCGKKIHVVCDMNADSKISLQEFLNCLSVRRDENTTNESFAKKLSPDELPLDRLNPFIHVITSE